MLGRDGLLIDSQTSRASTPRIWPRAFPPIIAAGRRVRRAAIAGALTTAVLEYRDGLAIVSVLSADAILLVLAQPQANIGQLLFELRRNRENIAALV